MGFQLTGLLLLIAILLIVVGLRFYFLTISILSAVATTIHLSNHQIAQAIIPAIIAFGSALKAVEQIRSAPAVRKQWLRENEILIGVIVGTLITSIIGSFPDSLPPCPKTQTSELTNATADLKRAYYNLGATLRYHEPMRSLYYIATYRTPEPPLPAPLPSCTAS